MRCVLLLMRSPECDDDGVQLYLLHRGYHTDQHALSTVYFSHSEQRRCARPTGPAQKFDHILKTGWGECYCTGRLRSEGDLARLFRGRTRQMSQVESNFECLLLLVNIYNVELVGVEILLALAR